LLVTEWPLNYTRVLCGRLFGMAHSLTQRRHFVLSQSYCIAPGTAWIASALTLSRPGVNLVASPWVG
jgi:hypothetical protein